MSANAPLLTTASRLSAAQDVDNYAAGVAAHINGDWGKHYQMEIINQPWVDSCGNQVVGSARLRLVITVNGVEVPVVIPVIPYIAASTGVSPSITRQPVNLSCRVGQSAQFSIAASGDPILAYQWLRNGLTIPGANSTAFIVTNANLGDNGAAYSCLVSNSYGQSLSNSVTLAVSFTVKSGSTDSGLFGIITSIATGGIA
jgi:hypothetical protein